MFDVSFFSLTRPSPLLPLISQPYVWSLLDCFQSALTHLSTMLKTGWWCWSQDFPWAWLLFFHGRVNSVTAASWPLPINQMKSEQDSRIWTPQTHNPALGRTSGQMHGGTISGDMELVWIQQISLFLRLGFLSFWTLKWQSWNNAKLHCNCIATSLPCK